MLYGRAVKILEINGKKYKLFRGKLNLIYVIHLCIQHRFISTLHYLLIVQCMYKFSAQNSLPKVSSTSSYNLTIQKKAKIPYRIFDVFIYAT